jgi:hypothetical protein
VVEQGIHKPKVAGSNPARAKNPGFPDIGKFLLHTAPFQKRNKDSINNRTMFLLEDTINVRTKIFLYTYLLKGI